VEELVTFIARSLVDQADEVSVRETDADHLELRVAPDDLGKVIGRQGRTARAIRTILSAASQKQRRHMTLDILD
jgi:predicted RNA-binding protein YlqC (UPF0109 family)